jgi:hypothetical protein
MASLVTSVISTVMGVVFGAWPLMTVTTFAGLWAALAFSGFLVLQAINIAAIYYALQKTCPNGAWAAGCIFVVADIMLLVASTIDPDAFNHNVGFMLNFARNGTIWIFCVLSLVWLFASVAAMLLDRKFS